MRHRASWIVVVSLLAGSRAALAQAGGATEWFGTGISRVRDNGTAVHLDLRVEAQGLLLRFAEREPVSVLRAGAFPAGPSVVRIPARATELASGVTDPGSGPVDPARAEQDARLARRNCDGRGTGASTDSLQAAMRRAECATIKAPTGQAPRTTTVPRAPAREYLLLVLSDQPLDSADLVHRLADLPEFGATTAAHDVAEYLVGWRSPVWAGYLARR